MSTKLPQEYQQYTGITKIGEGGFGEVYRARDKNLDREVALKVPHEELLRDPAFVKQFQNEARVAASLEHTNIVRIYRIDEIENIPLIEMELVDGKTLAELIREKGRYTPEDALAVIKPVCDALDFAHERGVIHRDVKPQNILVRTQDQRVMVTDFGLARATESSFQASLSSSNVVVGTFRYMPPEQANRKLGEIGPRSDIYSLGVVLYEMLTGRAPFDSDSVGELIYLHTSEDPEPPSNLNVGLSLLAEKVVLKALAKGPGQRYATAGELAKALSAACDGKDVVGFLPQSAAGETTVLSDDAKVPAASGSPPPKRNGLVAAGLILAALVLVALTGFVLMSRLRGGGTAAVSTPNDSTVVEAGVVEAGIAGEGAGITPTTSAPASAGGNGEAANNDREVGGAAGQAVGGTGGSGSPPSGQGEMAPADVEPTVTSSVIVASAALTPTMAPTSTMSAVTLAGEPTVDDTSSAPAVVALLPVEAPIITPTVTSTHTPIPTATETSAPTATPVPTSTPTELPTETATSTSTPDATETAAALATRVALTIEARDATATANAPTPTPDYTATAQADATFIAATLAARDATATANAPTVTPTPSPTDTPTPNLTATAAADATYVAELVAASDATATANAPTATPNATATAAVLETRVAATIQARDATATANAPTITPTPLPTWTPRPTATSTRRPTSTATQRPTPTRTRTPTASSAGVTAVTVTFTDINVRHDSDSDGNGEIWLDLSVNGQQGRWPRSGTVSVGEKQRYAINESITVYVGAGDSIYVTARGTEEDTHNSNDDFGTVSFTISSSAWSSGRSGEVRAAPSAACEPGCYILSYSVSKGGTSSAVKNYVDVTLVAYLDANRNNVFDSGDTVLRDAQVAWTCDEAENCMNNFSVNQQPPFSSVTFPDLRANISHSFQMCRYYAGGKNYDKCADTGVIYQVLGNTDDVLYMGWYPD